MKPYHFKKFMLLLDESRPSNVCEIGTHNGKTGSQMCEYLLSSTIKNITYTGYDAFDTIDFSESFGLEKNGKGVGNEIIAAKKFTKVQKKFPNRLEYTFVKGYTRDTLKKSVFDFVYIDAGHSYESVLHDWEMVKNSKMIVFDDWKMEGVLRVLKEHVEPFHEVEYTERSEVDRGLAIIRN